MNNNMHHRRKVRPLGVAVLVLLVAVVALIIGLVFSKIFAGGEKDKSDTPETTQQNNVTPSSSKTPVPSSQVETETKETSETKETKETQETKETKETATAEPKETKETEPKETKEPEQTTPATSSQKQEETPAQGTKAAAIVDLAKKLIGKPWVSGGKGPNSFDNTGLVTYVCKQNGVTDKLVTVADMKKAGTEVKRDDLKPGDIVIFTNEPDARGEFVGIYIGNNEFIASYNSAKPVGISTMKPGSYWGNHYITARRVV